MCQDGLCHPNRELFSWRFEPYGSWCINESCITTLYILYKYIDWLTMMCMNLLRFAVDIADTLIGLIYPILKKEQKLRERRFSEFSLKKLRYISYLWVIWLIFIWYLGFMLTLHWPRTIQPTSITYNILISKHGWRHSLKHLESLAKSYLSQLRLDAVSFSTLMILIWVGLAYWGI